VAHGELVFPHPVTVQLDTWFLSSTASPPTLSFAELVSGDTLPPWTQETELDVVRTPGIETS